MLINNAKTGIVLCLISIVAGCQEKLPEATDEQIAQLVAQEGRSSGSIPINIKTVECARMLSGLDDELYKDAPEDMIGSFKTWCRHTLQGWIEDPDRNPLGFELSDFEDSDLALRIEAIRDSQIAERQRQADIETVDEQRQIEEEIAGIKAEARAFRNNLADWEARIERACSAWQLARDEQRAKRVQAEGFDDMPHGFCNGTWPRSRAQIEQSVEIILAYEYDEERIYIHPKFSYYDPEQMQIECKRPVWVL